MLGLGFMYAVYKAIKSHTALEAVKIRLDRPGDNTTEVPSLLGGTFFATIKPENLKTILSLRFKDWVLGAERKKIMIPFLEEGLLETDGGGFNFS